VPHFVSAVSGLAVAGLLAVSSATAVAQGINPALKELAAAANKEGSLTLSWSGSTFAGIQGAARYQTAINKMFGTNIRVNFLPGPDMARIANQLATEFTANQRAHVDLLLGASPQLTPLVKIDFFERVDWKQYLPNRITDQMIELDGRIIRIVTGLSGATYNSRLAPMIRRPRSPISSSRNGRARSLRRPTPPASTCSMPPMSGARRRRSNTSRDYRARSPV